MSSASASRAVLGIVGATGVVGRQLLSALTLRDVPPERVRLFASERSEGDELDFGAESLSLERLDTAHGITCLILAVPPAAAGLIAARATQQGVWVVDLSGAHRLDEAVPLLAPTVNEGVLARPFSGRVVSMATPTAQALLCALEPLRTPFGLTFADVTVLRTASSQGNPGVAELATQCAELLNAKDPKVEVFPHRLAFNLLPTSGVIQGDLNAVERALLVECARVWSSQRSELPALTCTALTVPIYHGTTMVVSAHLGRATDAEQVRRLFKSTPGLKLLDEPEAGVYPMPMLTTDDAAIHVGRVRVSGQRLQFVAAVDEAFRAADSAVATALNLASRG